MEAKFDFGEVMTTKSISYHEKNNPAFHNEIVDCFQRHISCDFGIVCKEDKEANLEDIKNNEGRILSRYKTSQGDIYINTQMEAYDFKDNEPIFKKITMIMFCEEY